MITTNKTLADITWHPAHSPSDDTHKVMSSRTGELLHKGGIHLRHTRIAVAYVHVVKWSSVFKTSKVTLPNNLFQTKRNLACEYIRLSSLLAAWVIFVGETVVCASTTEIVKRIWSVRLPIRAPDRILDGFYVISMQFSSLTRRPLSLNVPSGKEPGETAVFAG